MVGYGFAYGRGPDEAYRALFRGALDEAVVNEIRATTNGEFVLARRAFRNRSQPSSNAAWPRAKPDGHRSRTPSAPALVRTVSKPAPGAMAAVDAKAADVEVIEADAKVPK
jgi:hypothetical protein